MHQIADVAIYLAAALIAVPLFRRAGFGAILGYLAGGIVIGPQVLGLIGEVEAVMQIAEIGVVLLLFVIGLELKPMRLWRLRNAIFGAGSLQLVAATAPLAVLAGSLAGLSWTHALFLGFALGLSSTAFVLQTLAEQGSLNTDYGRSAFGVLLFQDLAVIPGLAVLPALSEAVASSGGPAWIAIGKGLLAIVVLVGGGSLLLRPLFKMVARWGSDETFTVAALLVVIGSALAMQAVELSAGLGAFLAGVLLAESEYRHELEANINPFKGLLLGLFFISVGMSADLHRLAAEPHIIIGGALLLILIKAGTLALVARGLLRMPWRTALPLALVLGQGGEFAFVLFHAAEGLHVFPHELTDRLIGIVIVSMLLTPGLFMLASRIAEGRDASNKQPYDTIEDESTPVIIAGFGRMGQIVARVLHMRGIAFTALERDAEHVELVRRFGNKVYFGEPASLETLRAAGARDAQVLVLALDDYNAATRIVELAKRHFPHLVLMARARDRQQAMHLMELGVDTVIRETWLSSLELSRILLHRLGDDEATAEHSIAVFREADEDLLRKQLEKREDTEHLIETTHTLRKDLRALFESGQALREPTAAAGSDDLGPQEAR